MIFYEQKIFSKCYSIFYEQIQDKKIDKVLNKKIKLFHNFYIWFEATQIIHGS